MILCAFAVVVGELTADRIRSDFHHQTAAAADDLRDRISVSVDETGRLIGVGPNLDLYAAPEHAVIRVLALDGTVLTATRGAPRLGVPFARSARMDGFLVETRELSLRLGGKVLIEYGRRVSDEEATISRVRLFLVLGVLAGTLLALLAGLMIARRAMAPIAELTSAAREIELTRDPRRTVPAPRADDEVAELSRTLDGMLRSLADARAETEATLARQRQFVADASHELRTPLTSVLANLELLVEALEGDQGESARSALRSSQRMRRLVVDLLVLARADVGRVVRREPVDLGQVVIEAAAELGPLADGHELSVDGLHAEVYGTRDELHRLTANLIENALSHTPPGTRVHVRTAADGRGQVTLVVEDDGPGVPESVAPRLFERFVRGAGDRGGSFGLGLAIVRAVAESHGGSVAHERPEHGSGTRFVVTLPALVRAQSPASGQTAADEEDASTPGDGIAAAGDEASPSGDELSATSAPAGPPG